jgi:hypothetical protein
MASSYEESISRTFCDAGEPGQTSITATLSSTSIPNLMPMPALSDPPGVLGGIVEAPPPVLRVALSASSALGALAFDGDAFLPGVAWSASSIETLDWSTATLSGPCLAVPRVAGFGGEGSVFAGVGCCSVASWVFLKEGLLGEGEEMRGLVVLNEGLP